MPVFTEISLILLITTMVSFLLHKLKQPLVVGYILSGILVGPYVLNLLSSSEPLELFSKFGIVILLFIVGLNLNPQVIREVGKISLITGVGQVIFTSLVGFGIALLLGLDKVAALYVAIALTFSSTIIILKLLSDRGDVYSLYGKIAIGFLLVQDIIATLILFGVSAFTGETSGGWGMALALIGFKSVGLGLGLWLFTKYALLKITKQVAGYGELFFLMTLSWALIVAALFYVLDFSVEIGALIAGVTLSMTPFAYEVASKLKPLRDFFIVLFFVLLGSQMVLTDLTSLIWPALILSVFVLVGNPVIVIVLMNVLGYTKKTGFMAGLTVAQISEFSLILAALGLQVGHLDQTVVSLITLVALITITGSTYLILYADKLFSKLEPWLTWLELRKDVGDGKNKELESNALLFGYHRVGEDFLASIQRLGMRCMVVDHDPAAIDRIRDDVAYRFGDATSTDFLEELPLVRAKMIVSTLPIFEAQLLIVEIARRVNKGAVVIVMASTVRDANKLYEAGASYVMLPHYLGAFYTKYLIRKYGLRNSDYRRLRQKHLKELAKRGSDVVVGDEAIGMIG